MRISDWSSDVCSSDLDPEQDRTGQGDSVAHQRRLQPQQPARQPRQIFVIFAEQRAEAGLAAHGVGDDRHPLADGAARRSEEHTSELQSLMRISYAVFCLKKKNKQKNINLQ